MSIRKQLVLIGTKPAQRTRHSQRYINKSPISVAIRTEHETPAGTKTTQHSGGGSGFIGSRLTARLSAAGYDVMIVSRMPGQRRITWHELERNGLPDRTHAVVNVAGQNVLDPMRRWTSG